MCILAPSILATFCFQVNGVKNPCFNLQLQEVLAEVE